MFRSAAVFCGSKKGNNPVYAQHAAELGKLLAEKNIELVYGGGNRGLMGIIANAVLENKGKATGVMPGILNRIEFQHENLTTLHVVEDMHTRKKMMYDLCEAAIILPGGFGTMDELFEMITWNNLSIHDKKIILLNSAGYYDVLLQHISFMQCEGFLHENTADAFEVFENPEAIFSLKDAGKYQNRRG